MRAGLVITEEVEAWLRAGEGNQPFFTYWEKKVTCVIPHRPDFIVIN